MIEKAYMTKDEKEIIIAICKPFRLGKRRIKIHDDDTVDLNGNVNLSKKGLTELPIKFGVVTGDFKCYNKILTSFEGCPIEVGGEFNCSAN